MTEFLSRRSLVLTLGHMLAMLGLWRPAHKLRATTAQPKDESALPVRLTNEVFTRQEAPNLLGFLRAVAAAKRYFQVVCRGPDHIQCWVDETACPGLQNTLYDIPAAREIMVSLLSLDKPDQSIVEYQFLRNGSTPPVWPAWEAEPQWTAIVSSPAEITTALTYLLQNGVPFVVKYVDNDVWFILDTWVAAEELAEALTYTATSEVIDRTAYIAASEVC